jgi:hypothetical protein
MDTASGALNLAKLAREIAMDILPVEDILALHKVDDETWARIQADERWQAQLSSMAQDWNSAANAKERVKVKAQTGMEMLLETYIRDAANQAHPLVQRVEAGKLICRLGELLENQKGTASGQVLVQININNEKKVSAGGPAPSPVIDLKPVIEPRGSLAKVTE